VALVCERQVDPERKRALVCRLRHEALPCPGRGLELVVYRREVARAGSPEPGFEVELNTGPRVPFRTPFDPADRASADGRLWYALDRNILHQSGISLLGPPAAETFAEVGPADLRRLLVEALEWWLDRPTPGADDEPAPGAEDAVLGAARALVRLRHGVWLDKAGAGRRLLEAGTSSVIERSIAARQGGSPPTGGAARAYQQEVVAAIRLADAPTQPG